MAKNEKSIDISKKMLKMSEICPIESENRAKRIESESVSRTKKISSGALVIDQYPRRR